MNPKLVWALSWGGIVACYALRAVKDAQVASYQEKIAVRFAFCAVTGAAACFTLNIAWAAAIALFVYKAQPTERIMLDLFFGVIILACAIAIASQDLSANIAVWIVTAAVFGSDEREIECAAVPIAIALVFLPHTNVFWLAVLVLVVITMQYIGNRVKVSWIEKLVKIAVLVVVLATPVGWPHHALIERNPIPPEWELPACTQSSQTGALIDALGTNCTKEGLPCPLNFNAEVGKELVCGGVRHGVCAVTRDKSMAYCHCDVGYCGDVKFVPSSQTYVHLSCIDTVKCGPNGRQPQDEEIDDPPFGLTPKNNCECVCDQGYYGKNCSLICPGGTTNPCNGKGNCVVTSDEAKCACDVGYEGPACKTQVCSGNGARTPQGTCVCLTDGETPHPRYIGAICNVTCPTNCLHGFTKDEGNDVCGCECYQGYTGKFCDQCSDDRCAYNATCDAGTCKCKSAKQNIKTFCTTCLDPHFKMPTCDTCVPGRYGDTCAQECNCNGFPCDAQTGKCKCPVPQLAGSTCECECTGMEGGNCYDDEPTCQCNAGRCGKNCENNCSPEYGSCDKTTNQCVCKVPPASPNAECVPSDQAWMLRYR